MRTKDIGKYIVHSDGRVFTKIRNKFLKPRKTKHGYFYIGSYKTTIHRLVALSFIPNLDNKPHINHKDGNKLNNDVSNLEWVTKSENELHSYKIGLTNNKGEKNPNSKLTEIQVREIRKSFKSLRTIARKYNISETHVSYIKNRKTWKHVQ